jgi:hypothetical protein
MTFDPAAVEPSQGFEALPAGSYLAHIIESEVKDTKAGTGERLNLTWEIIDGPHEKRRVWQGINIKNQSVKAQEIGQGELSAILRAMGSGPIEDSEDMHFKPVIIRLKVEKDQNGNLKNEVAKVEPANAAPQPQPPRLATSNPAPVQQARPAQAAASGAKKPWG